MVTRRRILVTTAISVAVAAAVFFYALPQLAGYGAVWLDVKAISTPWLVLLVGSTVLNIVTFPLPWQVALPGIGWLDALKMTQASTAFGLVVPGGAPLGMAVSFAMLRRAGFARGDVASAVAVTGVWNQLSTFLFPLLAFVLLAAEGVGTSGVRLLALIGGAIAAVIVALVVAVLWRAGAAARVGVLAAAVANLARRVLRREPVTWSGEALARQRADLLLLLRRSWLPLTATTLVNQLTGYLMLEVAVRGVGISRGRLSIAETFAAWSVGRLIASLPITPGGIGFVELGLTGTLIGFGAPRAPAVAAVLVYRAASIVPTLALGLVSGLTWRRREPLTERS